jgi:tripartite-type tricarboxylate transporter receptor subunit TctC
VKAHLGSSLRPLVVGSRARLAEVPDVPTFSEAGFTEIESVAWLGLVLPAKSPEQMAAQIASHFRSALDTSEVRTKLKALAATPVGLCGADFAAYLREAHERTARIVKAANMKAD